MKIRKKYTLFVNSMLGAAFYGGKKFSRRIDDATLGEIYDCTFSELKQNLQMLSRRGYTIFKMKY
jgi:hypothetical protein